MPGQFQRVDGGVTGERLLVENPLIKGISFTGSTAVGRMIAATGPESVPGVSVDGGKTRQPATLTDIYPTLCELAGLPIPEQCDGTSLVPQLKDPNAPKERLALTSFQFNPDKAPSHAVADSRYRIAQPPRTCQTGIDKIVQDRALVRVPRVREHDGLTALVQHDERRGTTGK